MGILKANLEHSSLSEFKLVNIKATLFINKMRIATKMKFLKCFIENFPKKYFVHGCSGYLG
jgi:hypothetical protein